jgi:HEPN domain-containing protein
MKEQRDLVRNWLRKAESDLVAATLAIRAEAALDTACFHAQQAAEKLLKAYLLAHNIEFPLTHNLARLLLLCEARDPAFSRLLPLAESLTPYAVELRYDGEFWPTLEVAREARESAVEIKRFVLARLPPDVETDEPA